MLAVASDVQDILACPRCRRALDGFQCRNAECGLSAQNTHVFAGQPALIDFEDSIVDKDALLRRCGASILKRDPEGASLRVRTQRFLLGGNAIAKRMAGKFRADVLAASPSPLVLIIGGGDAGAGGAPELYDDPAIRVIGTDIYASPNTTLLADGHRLPFRDASLDGVWIQAVLEHVLDPWRVVAEIHRVLKPTGVVYADTPFLQPVHEGASDFTRFTLSGHRWLFRNFEMIAAGVSSGQPQSLNLAIRYLLQGVTRNKKIGTLTSFAFFWLRYLEPLLGQRWSADGASGVFFYGRRSDKALTPRQIMDFYDDQNAMQGGILTTETAIAAATRAGSGARGATVPALR